MHVKSESLTCGIDPQTAASTESTIRFSNLNEALIASWIIFSAWCVVTGITLSLIGELNRMGYLIALAPGLVATGWPVWLVRKDLQTQRVWKSTVWRQPVFFLYLSCLMLSFVGGAIHEPNNYDALVYRVPRLARWLHAEHYHWIGHFCPRMDFSSLGYEWLMLPGFAIFRTLRLAFLPNIVTLLLLPGAIHAVFTALGIKRSVVWFWMWVIPCASCFMMQSGSIGNDITATVYCLAAILFAIRAGTSGQAHHMILAALAAGLMTCAKASNLPLLLPVAISGIIALYRSPRLWLIAAASLPLFAAVSIIPLAVTNTRHTGYWTGSPDSAHNLQNPVIGIAGNVVQIGFSSIAPPIFPLAGKANAVAKAQVDHGILAGIRSGFPQFNPGFSEMAVEEGAGIGLGLMLVACLWLVASRGRFKLPRLGSEAAWVAAAFWVAVLVVMAKFGNPSVPRIIAPYYPGLFLPLLMVCPAGHLRRNRWFSLASALLLSPILIALIITPSRPLVRMDRVIDGLFPSLAGSPMLGRMKLVYDVYAARANLLGPVRDALSPEEKVVGFAGDDCDSEYFFWLPFGQRKVVDLKPLPDKSPPVPAGIDVIVTSETGSRDRFGLTPQELAAKLGWTIDEGISIRRLASMPETRWHILRPEN